MQSLLQRAWQWIHVGTLVVLAGFMFWVLQRSGFNLVVGLFLLIAGQALYMVNRSVRSLGASAPTTDVAWGSQVNLLVVETAYAMIAAFGVFLVFVHKG